MTGPMLTTSIRASIEANLVGLVDFLPTIVGAALIVYLGVFLGRKLQPKVTDAGHRVGLDETVRATPFGALFPDGSDAVSRTFAVFLKYYIALIGVFAAIEWFAARTAMSSTWLVSTWGQDLLAYVPPIVIGIVILFVGFYLANWATEQVRASPAAEQLGFTPVLAGATKTILYFLVLVIGLETMPIDAGILHTFGQAFAYGLGLAAALAVGIAVGWGGKDYVAENIDDWFEQTRDAAEEANAVTGDD
ncbi:mechanosensitive ion channel family protein [Halobiforma nitratireducens]|uniref:TM helix repeat-containing protein n=1 Tax=Halobiforma nitratireducens JCM 10879 TaxID=1227454 RepID=M0LK09_9EURY|nr:hypothetical protein [Halobiforma nitratireducens]EMA33393.1 hypothetical protein C446_14224 [Halobiforma nitratireducens JCM 10879]